MSSSKSNVMDKAVSKALKKLLAELKDKDVAVQERAAKKLKAYTATQSREMSKEDFTRFMNELINEHIFNLVNSNSTVEKIGGIMAIDELIDIEYDENSKTARLASYLNNALSCNDIDVMNRAAKSLGRLAQSSRGTLTAEFVEAEVKRALQTLKDDSPKNSSNRHSAVLVLRELAENAPTLFYVHVGSFFELVWSVLSDSTTQVRLDAVAALHAALVLIAERAERLRLQWYWKIYNDAQNGFKNGTPTQIHGSLITIGELLDNTGQQFINTRFKEVCDTILSYKDYKNDRNLVKRTVVMLLPRLAKFNPQEFVPAYLETCMTYLLGSLKKEKGEGDRAAVFLAIGQIALAVGKHITPYLDQIMVNIVASLEKPGSRLYCIEALSCISMLAKSVGPDLQPHMHIVSNKHQTDMTALLELMFGTGLSPMLTEALTELAGHIPSMLSNIQEKLMDHISLILAGKSFLHPDQRRFFLNATGSKEEGMNPYQEKPKAAIIQLALYTLGSFNLQEKLLIDFVRETVVGFLDDDDSGIRKAAAETCCSLLVRAHRSSAEAPTRGQLAVVTGEVLEKLLIVGIADPDPSVRKTVLSRLESSFDYHLAQAENLRSLFIALNDEVFEIRELAITTIGRLTIRNPAHVMPSLRKTLIQLLTELEFSGDSRNKEESARLLGHLIRSSRRLIKPYVEPILNVLLPKLEDPNPRVATCVLATLGELSIAGGKDIQPYIHQLLPLIIGTLQDKSSVVKREVALRTLGQLAQSTGYVIDPFLDYPNLMGIILLTLKTETVPSLRKEIVNVLGIMGALDPYKHKMNQMKLRKQHLDSGKTEESTMAATVDALMGGNSELYYLTVSVGALMKVLSDASLEKHHKQVVSALRLIFEEMRSKCVSLLPQIMPPFLQAVSKTKEDGFRDYLFESLSNLVHIVKHHIRDYLDDIFVLIKEYWHSSLLLNRIITLVEEISVAMSDEFKVYLPELIPQMLSVLHKDRDPDRQPTEKVLHALEVFGTNLDDYLHLIIPAVVKLFEQVDVSMKVRDLAIQTLGRLCNKLNFSDYASRIIHPLARALDYPELRTEAMKTLCMLVLQLGSDYAIFIPMVNKVLVKNRMQHSDYETLVSRLLKNQPLQDIEGEYTGESRSGGGMTTISPLKHHQGVSGGSSAGDSSKEGTHQPSEHVSSSQNKSIREAALAKAWDTSHSSTREDWQEWIRRFSVELMRESPSPAIRACLSTAQVFHSLASELFNASFVSCWDELHETYQYQLLQSLEAALSAEGIPPEILQGLLNLAEFMEHNDKTFRINPKKLGLLAEKCAAFAKALHYKEIEFQSQPADCCEALISINNHLDLPEAARGMLLYADKNFSNEGLLELKESWYEKLQKWETAKKMYEKKQKSQPLNMELTMGRMRCLHALAEWEDLSKLSKGIWVQQPLEMCKSIAHLAAAAAWNLGQWDDMQKYISVMPENTVDGTFFRAILNLHLDQYEEAQRYIDCCRSLLDTELRALVGESYNRAYKIVVKVQQLTEMEEIIDYKQNEDFPERRQIIREIWTTRLHGCQRNVEIWQDILAVRKMVLSPIEDTDNWLKFASICRKSGHMAWSRKTLTNLLGQDPAKTDVFSSDHPKVTVAYLKHMWDAAPDEPERQSERLAQRRKALEQLGEFTQTIRDDKKLLARCYHTLGEWENELNDVLTEQTIPRILNAFKQATIYDNEWYKAWHSWALSNFDVVSHYDKSNSNNSSGASGSSSRSFSSSDKLSRHLVPAIHGFFHSIALARPGKSLQDTLRLLTLWFKYGHSKQVEDALLEGFATVSIDTWLQVVPQLIARIHSPVPSVARLICDLLTNVGKEHPQALVYPLSVASKSQSLARVEAANKILNHMRKHDNKLVEDALLVSRELIRVAILWPEMWHEGLEEASRLYFSSRDFEGMMKKLEPLHKMMEKGPQTLREKSFQQAYGRDLQEAYEWCKKYRRSRQTADLNQAWDLYFQVFNRIDKQELPHMTQLELQYVSPKLLAARDLALAVPGTYEANTDEVVKIRCFAPLLTVISSKQRPRKQTMEGADGKEYTFLLKGHEDLRQDERVMQLFGLINTLLASDRDTANRHLSIQRYAIIPLSPNSGLIGWVPNHDTLHDLIKEYRSTKNIPLMKEHIAFLSLTPKGNPDSLAKLTVAQKVECFENALGSETDGKDLDKVLWLKSPNSEVWLERRTNYTRSLAVMSMVGYILGLGDRHPKNLMLDRYTGKITHIDFGDCFEVAMQRDKYPEKVPFRLTRMLIKAMEVSGIEGNFRFTCENVMRVLHENKESVMAVLEAFVYDPLINWRLLQPNAPSDAPEERRKISTTDEAELMKPAGTTPPPIEMFSEREAGMETTPPLTPSASTYRSLSVLSGMNPDEMQGNEMGLNERALNVIDRVSAKLRGKDFSPNETLGVNAQVQRLIDQATSHENLSQLYIGWRAFW